MTTEIAYDLGDPQFWINRRVACVTAGYPPSEADYVSIQEYVLAIEAKALAWEYKNAQNVGKYEREVDALRAALREIAALPATGRVHVIANAALKEN